MARIDVQTLVMAFEKRIEALEKNPPDKISTGVIIKMLENSIDDIIKDHFLHLVKKDIEKVIKKEFHEMRINFINKTIEGILTDSNFRQILENKIKDALICKIS
jgi:hypothetical protein